MVRVPALRVLLVLVPLLFAVIAIQYYGVKSSTTLAFALVGLAGAVPTALGTRPLQQKLEKRRESARVAAAGDRERPSPADRDDAAGQLGEQLEEMRKAFRARMHTWVDRTDEQERLV